MSYTHQFSYGLSATFGHTWLRQRGAESYFQGWDPEDPVNPQALHWMEAHNRHRVIGTWVYDLPFESNRRWVRDRALSLIVGGWVLAGAFQYQPGSLLSLGNIFFYVNPNSIQLGPHTGTVLQTTPAA